MGKKLVRLEPGTARGANYEIQDATHCIKSLWRVHAAPGRTNESVEYVRYKAGGKLRMLQEAWCEIMRGNLVC